MGVMQFLLPRRDRLPPDDAARCYLTGLDESPWRSRIDLTDEGLLVRRATSESGSFHVPWQTPKGQLLLHTASLMERERPYHLPLELARGTLNLLRNQSAQWQMAGLPGDPAVQWAIGHAHTAFARAATMQSSPTALAAAADEAIACALEGSARFVDAFTAAALAVRRQDANRVTKLIGAHLGSLPVDDAVLAQLLPAVNSAIVPLAWREIEARQGKPNWDLSDRQIEWCREQGLKVCAGPLVQLDENWLPDWIYLWEGDEENLLKFLAQHVESAVGRYRGRVHVWLCGARLNVRGALGLSEEQRLRLAVHVIELVRSLDPRTPLVLSIDQPWGEYLLREDCELAPLYWADALVRASLPLAALAIEVNLGYWPVGTQPRDLLEIGRQIDRWSCVGLPLLVTLTVPSAAAADPAARLSPQTFVPAASAETAQLEISRLVSLLLAKPTVQAVLWNQLADAGPHELPHAGLFDVAWQPKPTLQTLAGLRATWLDR